MLSMLALLTCVEIASAQTVQTDRPNVPSTGLAAEGGPGMLWVNPANMAYDPDPRHGLFVSHDLGQDPTSIAVTTGTSAVSVGVHNLSVPDGTTDWSLDYGTSIKLPERVAVGMRLGWHIRGADRNFVAYDVGGAWRPLPWFGLAAVARNISTPDPVAKAQSGFGLSFRPLGRFVLLGADYVHTFDETDPHDVIAASVRLRPARGLYLRGSVDSDATVGAGLEVYFGRVGVGSFGAMAGENAGVTAFVGTDEPGESLFYTGNRVPVLALDTVPPYQNATGLFGSRQSTWLRVTELLRRAEEDPSVRGVAIVLGSSGMSWAQAQELRNRILAFQDAGKPVVAYLHGSSSTVDYYLASAAQKVVLHPAQDLRLTGLDAELMFLRGAFDIAGVEPQFVRRAEYKSAVEQFTHTEASAPNLEQTEALLDDFHRTLVDGIARGRGRDAAQVQTWVDGGPWSADEALAMGMVDELAYPDEVEGSIEQAHQSSVHLMALEDLPQPHSGWLASSQIAVVYVEGAIVPGRSAAPGLFGGAITAGSATIVDALDQARNDENIRAVVLRVDSPGGSSFASDEIHRAVERLQEAGKPVVVSMGSVAASGGYYVAAGADEIWAEPTTITGSIGVYSGKYAIGGLLDRVGIETTSIQRGRNAGIESMTDPWDDVEEARMQALVDHTYTQFKQKVIDGRGLTPEQVEQVARGRVWSGHRAMEVGLVDGMGGMYDAIKSARVLANIPDDRQVMLVTYGNNGILSEAISPTYMQDRPTFAAVRYAFPDAWASLAERAEPPPVLPGVLTEALGPVQVMATHPDEIWMMEPWLLRVDGR